MHVFFTIFYQFFDSKSLFFLFFAITAIKRRIVELVLAISSSQWRMFPDRRDSTSWSFFKFMIYFSDQNVIYYNFSCFCMCFVFLRWSITPLWCYRHLQSFRYFSLNQIFVNFYLFSFFYSLDTLNILHYLLHWNIVIYNCTRRMVATHSVTVHFVIR